MKRYILFMRPVGSACWFMAMKTSPFRANKKVPAQFIDQVIAANFAKQYINQYVQEWGRNIKCHIAGVELPV